MPNVNMQRDRKIIVSVCSLPIRKNKEIPSIKHIKYFPCRLAEPFQRGRDFAACGNKITVSSYFAPAKMLHIEKTLDISHDMQYK